MCATSALVLKVIASKERKRETRAHKSPFSSSVNIFIISDTVKTGVQINIR